MKTEYLYIIAALLLTLFSFAAWYMAKLVYNYLMKNKIKRDKSDTVHHFVSSAGVTFVNLAICFLLSAGFVFSYRLINYQMARSRLDKADVVTDVLKRLGYDPARLSSLQYGVKYRINNESRLEEYQSQTAENKDSVYDSEIVTRFFNEFFQDNNRKYHGKYILNLFDQVLMQNNTPIPAVKGISTLIYRLSGLETNNIAGNGLINYLKDSFSPKPGVLNMKYPNPKNILYGMGTDFEMVTRELNKIVVNDEDGYMGIKFIIAYLDNTSNVMYSYFKIANQISGIIQLLTYVLFFWGIAIMSVRLHVLKNEKRITGLWKEFINSGIVNIDAAKRGRSIIPEYNEISLHEVEAEKNLLGKFSTFIAETKSSVSDQIFFTLQIMNKLWDNLTESFKKSRYNIPVKSVEDVFNQAEKSLDNVEYSNINYITWAIPSLGFLGTVLGISQALGNSDEVVKAPDVASQALAITEVTTYLGVAFDTTLIALICSIPLFFLIQGIRSGESKFLISLEQKISTLVKERLKYLEN